MADLGDMAGKLAQKGADLAGFGSNVVGMLRGGAIVGAIGLALNELKKFNDEIVQSVVKAVEQSAELGITVGRYQAYIYALSKVGVEQGKADSILTTYTQHLRDAVAGKSAAIDAFENLGIKILDANGKLRTSGETMAETARAILAMKDADQQAAAAKDLFGLSITRAVPVLKQLAANADDLDRAASSAHVALDEKIAKSIEATTHRSGQAALAIKGLYAEIALPIFLGEIDRLAARITLLVGLFNKGKFAATEFFKSIPANLDQFGADNAAAARRQADADIAMLEKRIAEGADPGPTRRLMDPNGGAEYKARLEQQLAQRKAERAALATEEEKAAARAAAAWLARGQGDVNKADRDRLMYDGLPAKDLGRNPDKTDKPGAGGGGGADRIETAINRLEGEKAAAEEALARMIAGSGLPLKELERQVELDKKIADEVARLGATRPGDPRIAEITQLVTANEKARTATKQYVEASREAEQTEKSLGDGTLYLRTEQQRLNEQVASGRLDWDTYGVALQQANEKSEDMRLKLIGQQGGFTALVAGMQNAANQWERNNRSFQNGGRIFDSLLSTMDQALSDFATKGEVNFGKLAGSFALMIAQMEMKAAASAVWSSIGGFGGILGFFGIGGGGSNQGGFATEGSGAGATNGVPNFSGNADGGDVSAGVPSWVGEAGKELFVPSVPGSILNHAQLRNMFAGASDGGGGGGGDGGVTIVQHMNFGSDVNRAELETRLARHKQETIGAVIDARRRGGPIKKAFG